MLRAATAPQHREAESRSFISRLMAGELNLGSYTAYLGQYAHIYQALEARVPSAGDPAPLGDDSLARLAAIESDLRALGVDDWREQHPALAATSAYVARLESLPRDDVPRYLAHHYTRYLGDLSGGQAIGALVARHYGATDDQLAFYRFDAIESPVVFKRAYREAVDALDFSAEDDEALVDEARVAFELNAGLFDALDAHLHARSL